MTYQERFRLTAIGGAWSGALIGYGVGAEVEIVAAIGAALYLPVAFSAIAG